MPFVFVATSEYAFIEGYKHAKRSIGFEARGLYAIFDTRSSSHRELVLQCSVLASSTVCGVTSESEYLRRRGTGIISSRVIIGSLPDRHFGVHRAAVCRIATLAQISMSGSPDVAHLW